MQGPRPVSSSRLAWQGLVNACNNSKALKKTVEGSCQTPVWEIEMDEWYDEYLSSKEKNLIFAQKKLKTLLQAAFIDEQKERCYTDEDGNQYAIKKEEGKVKLVKQSPDLSEEQITLFEYDIQELEQATYAEFQNNQHSPCSLTLAKLLKKNRPMLLQLAEKIAYHNDPTLPLSLIQSASAYIEQVTPMKLSFPLFWRWEAKYQTISAELKEFCQTGQLPDSAQKKCQLALEYCTECTSRLGGGTPIGNLRYILEDLTHLDFLFSTDLQNALSHSYVQIKVLKVLCEFIGKHFQGNAISFKGLNLHDLKSDKNENPLLAISQNPHLASIRFEKSACITSCSEEIIPLFETSRALTELTFDDCNLDDKMAVQLSELFTRNPRLKIASLPNNRFTVEKALLLLNHKNLISLNLTNSVFKTGLWIWDISRKDPVSYREKLQQNNMSPLPLEPDDYKILWEALKKNKNLTSFQFDWPNAEMQNECPLHLKSNYYHKLRLLSYSEKDLHLPHEILQIIFQMGIDEIKNA